MLTPPSSALPPLEQLRQLMAQLRGPGGCPWDREQNHRTLRGSVLEEAYEVAAAISSGDDANLREELGDLLLQVVFHSQLASEDGRFTLDDVARGIVEKLVRRHPHVFGAEEAAHSGAVLQRWEEIKRAEKGQTAPESLLDGLTPGLPALLHAGKVQGKAAKAGMDWEAAAPVVEKVREELGEVEALLGTDDPSRLEDEIGDLLFSVVNLARKLRLEPEVALARATGKFSQRFRAVEKLARARGVALEPGNLARLDPLWDEVKGAEVTRPAAPR